MNKVIAVLVKAYAMELQAIIQYMAQHYILFNADYGALAERMKAIAIEEMKHAERFAERLKELNGVPGVEAAKKPEADQDVREIHLFDNSLEIDTIAKYNDFSEVCRDAGDVISARLFEEIAAAEQEHANYFERVAAHIDELGESYLAVQAGEK